MTEYYPRDALRTPRFTGISTFMNLPVETDPRKIDVAIVGIPFDSATTYRPGARFGPREVRLHSALIRPYNPATRTNPYRQRRIADFGDIETNPFSMDKTLEAIEAFIDTLLREDVTPVLVGGDHSVTLPILRAVRKKYGPVAVVHFDAHPDTWDQNFGMQYTHGTWFRRAVEEGLVVPTQVYQIGIRGQLYSEEDLDFPLTQGFHLVTIEEFKARGVPAITAELQGLRGIRTYISFDIDCIDPAFAPGTGVPQVGGMDSFEAVQMVRGLRGLDIVGVDLVEVSPAYDNGGAITSVLAANLLYEFLCVLPQRVG